MKIIAICGKSASGKSYYVNELLKTGDYHSVKSYTTRKIRENDPNDINTHVFVDKKYYLDNIDKVIALYHSPTGYISWTDINSFSKDKVNLYVIDPIAVREELYPYCKEHNIELEIRYLNVPDDIRMERFFKREHSLNNYNNEEHLSIKQLEGVDAPINVIDNYETNYCFSIDDECYYDCGTFNNTMLDMIDFYLDYDNPICKDKYGEYFTGWIGEVVVYQDILDARDIIETLQNQAYDDAGEISTDGYLEYLSEDNVNWLDIELNKLIKEWKLKFNIEPPFFNAHNVHEYKIYLVKDEHDHYILDRYERADK